MENFVIFEKKERLVLICYSPEYISVLVSEF